MLRQRAQGFTLVELMIVVAIIGILAALAVPNFVKFQARSKQAEAKASLRSYFSAEKHYFSEKDSYTDNMSALAFLPERGNRYSYRSMVVPTTWQVRTGANPTGADFNGIEVDCFKLGPGCTGRPVRSPGTAAFVTAYESTVTGPTDTGYIIGPNGGWILEAIGTIDNDAENDDWLVSSGTITVPPGPCSEDDRGVASVAVAVYNDVSCP